MGDDHSIDGGTTSGSQGGDDSTHHLSQEEGHE